MLQVYHLVVLHFRGPHLWTPDLPAHPRMPLFLDTVWWQPHRHHLEQRVPREHETQLEVNMGRRSRRSPYHPDVSASRVSARTTQRGLPRTAFSVENRAQLLWRQQLPNTRAGLKAGDVRMPEAGAERPGRQSPERGHERLVGA